MKPSDYLLPAAFRQKESRKLKDRIENLKDQLAELREDRDQYKTRAKEAEAELRKQKRLHTIDPHRCRAILAERLANHSSPAVQSRREALAVTSPLIDLEDDMMWSSTTEGYFDIGLHALDLVLTHAPEIESLDAPRILDLPCGHGRVTRWLRTCFPEARLYGCDIQDHGMEFCRDQFQAVVVPPAAKPSEMETSESFDLIFIGSLFTHLPKTEFDAFLARLPSLLAENGKVIFTTHGEAGIAKFRDGFDFRLHDVAPNEILDPYGREGFAYAAYRRSSDYGISFSSRAYLEDQLKRIAPLETSAFVPGGWGGFQDVVVCRKSAAA